MQRSSPLEDEISTYHDSQMCALETGSSEISQLGKLPSRDFEARFFSAGLVRWRDCLAGSRACICVAGLDVLLDSLMALAREQVGINTGLIIRSQFADGGCVKKIPRRGFEAGTWREERSGERSERNTFTAMAMVQLNAVYN